MERRNIGKYFWYAFLVLLGLLVAKMVLPFVVATIVCLIYGCA